MTNGNENEDRFPKTERVDLVICTWNRKEQLAQALASVFRLIVPYDIQLRLIVVNNGSTDGTGSYLEQISADRFFSRHQLLVLDESQQGHTHARNRAIASLDSDLVMWTDDDVTVAGRWVQETVAFADAHPEAAFFGGKILAQFDPPPPKWITENWSKLKGCFAERDLGDEVLIAVTDPIALRSKLCRQNLCSKTIFVRYRIGPARRRSAGRRRAGHFSSVVVRRFARALESQFGRRPQN